MWRACNFLSMIVQYHTIENKLLITEGIKLSLNIDVCSWVIFQCKTFLQIVMRFKLWMSFSGKPIYNVRTCYNLTQNTFPLPVINYVT